MVQTMCDAKFKSDNCCAACMVVGTFAVIGKMTDTANGAVPLFIDF